jgi:hypothetical protein
VEGNLGVLISGPKGLGKSLTVKNICKDALNRGLPVILVQENLGHIIPYMDTICQPCVIVMDEFEKLYPNQTRTEQNEIEGQESLLNLFDSTLAAKKLFLLTCNDVRSISEFLLNRPGRIHYHFKANRLSITEITEYCGDSLLPELLSMIPDICALGARIPDFSYDMLRAIIFELNTYKCQLKEVQQMLNINAGSRSSFNFKIYFASGRVESGFDYININSTHARIDWYPKNKYRCDYAYADLSMAHWTGDENSSLVLTEGISWEKDDNECENDRIEKIIFTPAKKGYLANGNDWDY